MRRKILQSALATAVAVLLPASGYARSPVTPNALRIRGTIERLEGDVVLIRTREGASVAVRLRENCRFWRVEAYPLAAIAPGDVVEAFALPGTGPHLRAVAVEVRPGGAGGEVTADAHVGWDNPPGGTRTLSPVVGVEELAGGGRLLDLTHRWGRQIMEVPPDALVVRRLPVGRDALAPGTLVFTAPSRGPDRRSLVAVHVTVGDAAVPPPG